MKKLILMMCAALLFSGCIPKKEIEYKLIVNKDIENLYPGEDLEISIESKENFTKDKLAVYINGKEVLSKFNTKVTVTTPDTSTKLIVTVAKTVKEYSMKVKKEDVKSIVYIYMAANNDMDNQAGIDIEKIRRGTLNNSNISAYIYVNGKNAGYKDSYLIVKEGNIKVLKECGEENTGAKETLVKFINYGKNICKGERNYFIFWNHGNGWLSDREDEKRGIGYDETNDDWLNLYEVEEGLNSFQGKFNIILFDACLMNSIEVCYQLQNNCNYILGSAEELPMAGYDYVKMMKSLTGENMSDIGKEIINDNIARYETREDFAVYSFIDMSGIAEISISIDNLAKSLKDYKSEIRAYKNDFITEILTYSSVGGDYSANTYYADLKNLCQFFAEKNIAKVEAEKVIESLEKNVIFNRYTIGFEYLSIDKSGGISIYFPIKEIDPTYFFATEFGKTNSWSEMIGDIGLWLNN